MRGAFTTVAILTFFLTACGQLGPMITGEQPKKKPKKKELTGLEAYQQAGGRVSGISGFGDGGQAVSRVSSAGIVSEADIVWAPEDPSEAFQGDLEKRWTRPESKSWIESHREATRYSRESGKPLLIWFTNSSKAVMGGRLSSQLFSKSDFESWAAKNIVRLRIDEGAISRRGDLGDQASRQMKVISKLKKRYNVNGYPTVVIVSPRGNVFASYRGYRSGQPDYYWGRLKQAVSKAKDEYGTWREKMEKRGYRMWTNRKGRKIFAKIVRFRSGKVTLVDPDGKGGTTRINKLSDADQEWIMERKREYDQKKARRAARR